MKEWRKMRQQGLELEEGEGEKNRLRGRVRVREKEKGGMVFVNPSTSGFYQDVGAAKIMFFTLQAFLCYKLPTSHCAFLTETLSVRQYSFLRQSTQLLPLLLLALVLSAFSISKLLFSASAVKSGLSSCQPSTLPVCPLVFIILSNLPVVGYLLLHLHESVRCGSYRGKHRSTPQILFRPPIRCVIKYNYFNVATVFCA